MCKEKNLICLLGHVSYERFSGGFCFIYINTKLFQSNSNKNIVVPEISGLTIQHNGYIEICS